MPMSEEGVETPFGFAGSKLPKADEKTGHRERFSDSSHYDGVCVLCGKTDADADFYKSICPKAVPDPVETAYDWKNDHVTHRSLLSGRVKRYNVWPTITSQTVGDHTWGVYHTYFRVFGIPSDIVGLYIHLHDVEELVVGDNPFPSKMMFPKLKEGTTEAESYARKRLQIDAAEIDAYEKYRVKVCDLLEMMTFGMQEREMGNLLATPIIERTGDTAKKIASENLYLSDYGLVEDYMILQKMRHEDVLKTQGSTR